MSKVEAEAEAIYDKLGRGAQADVKTISAALLAAEKRGEERERERACKILIGFADSIAEKADDRFEVQLGESIASCADAIRAGN